MTRIRTPEQQCKHDAGVAWWLIFTVAGATSSGYGLFVLGLFAGFPWIAGGIAALFLAIIVNRTMT